MSCVRSDTAAYLPIVTVRKLAPNTNHSNINTYPPTRVRTTLGVLIQSVSNPDQCQHHRNFNWISRCDSFRRTGSCRRFTVLCRINTLMPGSMCPCTDFCE